MRLAAALPLILLATPLAAETGYACAFSVQCTAAGACEPVDRLIEIGVSAEGTWFYLSETADPLPAFRLSGDGEVQSFAAYEAGPAISTLLTINPDGTALLSQHQSDSAAVIYFGTCEATE